MKPTWNWRLWRWSCPWRQDVELLGRASTCRIKHTIGCRVLRLGKVPVPGCSTMTSYDWVMLMKIYSLQYGYIIHGYIMLYLYLYGYLWLDKFRYGLDWGSTTCGKARATGKLKQLKGANSIVQAGELLGSLELQEPSWTGTGHARTDVFSPNLRNTQHDETDWIIVHQCWSWLIN